MRLRQLTRMLTIQRVLVKHGLDEIVWRTHLFRPLAWARRLVPFGRRRDPMGVRLREALEELGPIFVKFGQALSVRPDLLPPEMAAELAKLQDQVPPFPGELAAEALTAAFGRPVDEVFADFDRTPLAAASIAQVHTARLPGGQAVVVKVLRPKVAELIRRVDTIEKGDLLTVTGERGDSYIIQTFNGQKGSVAKVNVSRLAESVQIYDELIEANPREGRLYTLRAGANWAIADNEKALADFNKAIELGYEAAHAFSSRGLFRAAIGEYDAAIADYTKAIEKDPKDEVPLVNRASVYMSMGKYEEAVQDYTKALAINDKNAVYFQQRAIAHKLLGSVDKAVEDYDKAIGIEPSNVAAWMGRGFIKFQSGKPQDAIDDFSKVIELSPGTAVAFNNRGFNYQLLKQYDKADKDFKEALKLAPKYVLALQNRGWLLTTCEDESLRDAAAAVEIAKAVCELSEYKDVSDLTLLAAAYALNEEFSEAIGWQEKVIEFAAEPQKAVSKKILELYQKKQPLDPKLLEVDEAAQPAKELEESKANPNSATNEAPKN